MLNAANFLSSYWFDIDGFWHRNGAVILVLVLMLLSKIKDEEADDVQFRVLSENRLGDRFSPHNWEQVAYWVQEVINERITYAIITITFTHTQIFGWYFLLNANASWSFGILSTKIAVHRALKCLIWILLQLYSSMSWISSLVKYPSTQE